jgi:hypothetical protein
MPLRIMKSEQSTELLPIDRLENVEIIDDEHA